MSTISLKNVYYRNMNMYRCEQKRNQSGHSGKDNLKEVRMLFTKIILTPLDPTRTEEERITVF